MTAQGRAQRRQTEETLDRTLVLVGLMGAGKSSLGRVLAQGFGVPFVDADDEIVAAAGGMSIAEIFDQYGEPEFRRLEREVMARLVAGSPCVLAAGGGAFMDADTRAVIAEHGLSLWIDADLDVLDARTRGRTHRPLLNTGDSRAVLAALMDQRYPVYATADLRLEARDEPLEKTAARARALIAEHLSEDRA